MKPDSETACNCSKPRQRSRRGPAIPSILRTTSRSTLTHRPRRPQKRAPPKRSPGRSQTPGGRPRGPSPSPLPSAQGDRQAPPIWDKDDLRFVSQQPCCVCGREPCEPHHIRFAQPRAISRKVSDEFTVPLCRVHHREIHRRGDEAAWWAEFSIDPMPIALQLWQQTRGVSGPPDQKPQRSADETDKPTMATAKAPANVSSVKNTSP